MRVAADLPAEVTDAAMYRAAWFYAESSLYDYVRDHGAFDPKQAARIGLELLNGLVAAHTAGRDASSNTAPLSR